MRVNASAHAVSGGPRLEAALRAGIGCHSEAAACNEAKRVEYVKIQLTLTSGDLDDNGCGYRSLSGPSVEINASLSWIGATNSPCDAVVVCSARLLLNNCYTKLKEAGKLEGIASAEMITVESDYWMRKTCGPASMPSLDATFDYGLDSSTPDGPSDDRSKQSFVRQLQAALQSSPSYESFLNGPTQTG